MTLSLHLTSTSFLLPGNAAWQALGRESALTFGGYGDWASALMSGQGGALAWVLVLEDVVMADGLDARSDAQQILAPLIDALSMRLTTRGNQPTVVAWTAWRVDSPIRDARERSPWRMLGQALENALYALAQRHPALLLIDLDPLFAAVGSVGCFDLRNWYAAHCRFSRSGIDVIARALVSVLGRLQRAARKVLVLDCDNTLWGGVVGEVGLSGLVLGQDGQGQMFTDFQRVVVALASQGVVVCLASKNNAEDVWKVFAEHPGMVLKREHIIAARIDWNEKAHNVIALAEELSLGLGSMVFWDDNPLERERMRLLAPQVLTPEPPADVARWPALLSAMDEFAKFSVTDEDRRKVEQYRSVEAFAGERRTAGDETAFLRSIALRPALVAIAPSTVSRAAQLCGKTNQFNLRTVRHSEADVTALAATSTNVVFLAHLADRFGDHGLVALVAAVGSADAQVAFLDSFLLSCRVLGRHLEAWALAALLARLRAQGVLWLVAEYRPTAANVVAKGFLADHGMTPLAQCTPADRERLISAIRPQHPEEMQEMFVAHLTTYTVPHLEAYAHVATNPS